MKKILSILLFVASFSAFGQTKVKLKQIEPTDSIAPFTGTVSQLRALSGQRFKSVVTTDNNGGTWKLSPGDTASDNTGTVVVTADGKRYRRVYDGVNLYAEWFGVVGDGSHDDTQPFQRAINSLGDGQVLNIKGWIRIKDSIVVNQNRVTIKGTSGYSLPIIQGIDAGKLLLKVTGYGVNLENLSLRGDGGSNGSGATMRGVSFIRADGTKDIDGRMVGCMLDGFAQAAYVKGINLRVFNCTFSSSLEGINAQRNGSDELRGIVIDNNRFHSMGTIGLPAKCVVLSSDAFDCRIANNMVDNIYTFFEGPINGTDVANNTIYRCSGDAINTISATYTTQQRCGRVSDNTIFMNAPSYVGSGIVLRMQNGQCSGNVIVGPRKFGIQGEAVTGSIITNNSVLSHNFVAADGAIYDGIYLSGASSSNIIGNNHVRAGGITGVRSGINVVNAGNILDNNWIDTLYTAPYLNQQPFMYVNGNNVGIRKKPVASMDVAGNEVRITRADVIAANPADYAAAFSRSASDVFVSSLIRNRLVSSTVGAEKGVLELWTQNNGTLTKGAEVDQNSVFKAGMIQLYTLNIAPSSATDTGTAGEIRITADYIYVCTATNTWVRAPLATW